ncbi:MAG: uroporphyrinogen-III synthase [Bacteroidia bacterium]|nr:uroporphyrinogen-III synthase [Bacteroidia bacterium]NNK53041.1 uroporphyrinogen-III synthase [Flavobacteriaceae bacterium]NNM07756.1 uroporphyrinogen-III synthase [Flavobacteriaceae bacterium]
MRKVLSTKKLTLVQKELLLNSGISLIEYDAISISPLDFELPESIRHAIFTSNNAVEIVFNSRKNSPKIDKVYCVGAKTSRKLTDLGQNVVKTADNASKLSHFILNSFENEDFYFFCGSLRRDEIIEYLKSSKNRLFEVKTYKTELKRKIFGQIFDGIMFFSPSAVASFTLVNKLSESNAFCIGETTAAEAKKHTKNVYVSNNTSIESVIAKTVKILKKND